MRKVRLNSSGFSIVEGLLIIVIVGAIGFVGWWVYKTNVKTQSTFDSTVAGAGDAKKSQKYPVPKVVSSTTKGTELPYKYEGQTLYYTPLSGWQLDETAYTVYGGGASGGFLTLKSPDYKERVTNDGECRLDTEGTVLSVWVNSDTKSNDEEINSFLKPADGSSEATFTKNPKQVTMGSQKAVQYLGTSGECGYTLHTLTVYKGHSISVDITADATLPSPYVKEPSASYYDALVKSIRFE